MSTPLRKPPLWHFTYSDFICLQSYEVCKDCNITIAQSLINIRKALFYYLRITSTFKYKILK